MQEARPKSHSAEVKVRQLENYVLLATKSKSDVELALRRFMEMTTSMVRGSGSCDPFTMWIIVTSTV